MSTSKLVISLDFELFWGVCHAHTVASYGRNVLGDWQAIPQMLALFHRYGIRASWATVGMVMCRDYQEWRAIRPSVLPGYARQKNFPYAIDRLINENPELFFARPLVEQILDTPGQELATHTYSHFYCGEPEATVEQFAADLACAQMMAANMGVHCRSLVFPRNQVIDAFLAVLPEAGIVVYRGNPPHWLYRNGDVAPGGLAGRAIRFADGCLPLSGARTIRAERRGRLVNVPASLFLYPCADWQSAVAPLRMRRMKQCMTAAARRGDICHLWWHPHNFGVNTAQNLALLELLLQHYRSLADKYGMQSSCMEDFAALAAPAEASADRPSPTVAAHLSDPVM